jgi:hypothetical protein
MITRALALVALCVAPLGAQSADLIITGRIWTGDSTRPWAEAVAIAGNRILAVGTAADLQRYRAPSTRMVDAPSGFVAPGFIDNHTHFGQAGALLLGVNLLDVRDEAGLVRRVREARDRVPTGAWLVGGEWGAYALDDTIFHPHRGMIDSITPTMPALLSKWDRTVWVANGAAMIHAGVTCAWDGVECEASRPTGRLTPAAAVRVRATMPPKSLDQRLAEARVALAQLRSLGVTTIHDNTSPEQMVVFRELQRRRELSVRVYARYTLDRWEHLARLGIRHGFGDDWIRIGGLKGFVDGIMGNSSARFYEPYLTSGELGSWRTMMTDAPGMLPLLLGADSAGLWPQVHAIGDAAIDTLLDMYEHVIATNGGRPRRLRVIHTQVMRGPDVAARMARHGILAEVQPYHAIDDMRWMEPRIGARARWAYAFQTLERAGVRLSFGSDWPGTNASWYPASPVLGIYAAVTRQTLDGQPAGGWFPQERVSVETALRAYTVNNAWAAGEEAVKGALREGMLADLVVLDRDPTVVSPGMIRDITVLFTVVDGRIVYERDRP